MARTYFYIQKGKKKETPLLILLHWTSKFKHNVVLQIQSLQFITEYLKPSLGIFHFLLDPILNLPQGFGDFQSTMQLVRKNNPKSTNNKENPYPIPNIPSVLVATEYAFKQIHFQYQT